MKIALDCQVSNKIAKTLRSSGFDIVYHAGYESDELWLNKALDLGARVFVGVDYDVENFALNRGLEFIRLPKNQKPNADKLAKELKNAEFELWLSSKENKRYMEWCRKSISS